jgi:GNAT superfamily N-acetyltransferase
MVKDQIRVRPAWSRDLEACEALDHSYTTDRVWQMETREVNAALTVTFRVARLPREIRVNYPRQGEDLLAGWRRRDVLLVAQEAGRVYGYVGLNAQVEYGIAWVGDLVVDRPWRRRGIGTVLLRAAARWGRDHDLVRVVIGVQTKDYPAIQFCHSRGLTLCGYNDHYWPSQDIAVFFGESLR